jgi:hypothetical protein
MDDLNPGVSSAPERYILSALAIAYVDRLGGHEN